MIVYYITSHGFGHAARSCEVIRNLPAGAPLTLRTAVPESFLRHELRGRPFTLAPAEFDCGVLGPDSSAVDLERTVAKMEGLLARNEGRLTEEVEFLQGCGARLVVADVAPFALRAAREAGLPSILIANFTWTAIYQYLLDHYCEEEALAGRTRRVIEAMQREYDMGELMLATDMRIPMRACRQRRDVPLVARKGTSRRERLIEKLKLDPARPIYLLYVGRDGMAGMQWERLARLEGMQLVSYTPPPGSEHFVHMLPEELIDHIDAAPTVDAVIAKAGYGICSECISTSTPLIYPPRPQFAEMLALDEVMERWGGGLKMSEEDFKSLNWQPYLERMEGLTLRPETVDCTGGPVCARTIMERWER